MIILVFQELEKGRYSETDSYLIHAVTKGEKNILLASDKRIFLVSKNDLLGQWKVRVFVYFYLISLKLALLNTKFGFKKD